RRQEVGLGRVLPDLARVGLVDRLGGVTRGDAGVGGVQAAGSEQERETRGRDREASHKTSWRRAAPYGPGPDSIRKVAGASSGALVALAAPVGGRRGPPLAARPVFVGEPENLEVPHSAKTEDQKRPLLLEADRDHATGRCDYQAYDRRAHLC